MNKTELAQSVAEQVDSNPTAVRRIIDSAVEVIAAELERGGEVSIAGFGKFAVSERAARQGRNPATGETIQIAASKAPRFTASSALKTRVNK